MRLLIDREGLGWDQAWRITTASTGYTNHTILPEALEKWPVKMFGQLLPRHLQIIYEINARFMRDVATRWPLEDDRLRRMSIIDEAGEKYIRMAHLAIGGFLFGERRRQTPHRASEERGAEGFRGIMAGEIQQQNQRHHPAALAPQRQSGSCPSDYRIHRRPMDHRFGSASEAGTVRG